MTKNLIALLLVAVLLIGCAPAALPPRPTAEVTQTIAPTETPTESPSPTPSPIPQTHEHLLVTRDHEHWASLNADGSLQRYIQIPDIADPSDVSPDGKWLVYESGSTEPPYDLSLNLLNLDDETSFVITKLISPDFPNNIERLWCINQGKSKIRLSTADLYAT
jgi:hypothetical protein